MEHGGLRAAIRHCEGLCDPSPLLGALSLLAEPWTVAVVGRVGVGKSTLVSAWSGLPRPIGLGGVTRALEIVETEGMRLLDTPGIDDADAALLGLERVVADADGVVWVTDGLQPWTATERDLASLILVPGRPLWIVVSRVDIVPPDEVPAVLERVTTLSRPLRPRAVVPVDLRSALREGRGAPRLEPPIPGPRRVAAVREAVRQVRAQLDERPAPSSPEEIAGIWAAEVRDAIREIELGVLSGAIAHPTEALAALGGRAQEVLEAVARACAPFPPPDLPCPASPSEPLGRQLLGRLAGIAGATRAVKTEGARWLLEGELVIRDGWPGADELARAVDARARLVASLDAVEANL
ncbi:MAG: 50S ribosome-binding GTPase [Alphaproteobacteria bacterium]|nr:50S ribosome-binding GTPase [Alphaproteobacteria bacterium]MCB9698402.1 50S ribosome-binding GTPase [Alphaproteobacteria bacterium]